MHRFQSSRVNDQVARLIRNQQKVEYLDEILLVNGGPALELSELRIRLALPPDVWKLTLGMSDELVRGYLLRECITLI
jgi:hypothetical protein